MSQETRQQCTCYWKASEKPARKTVIPSRWWRRPLGGGPLSSAPDHSGSAKGVDRRHAAIFRDPCEQSAPPSGLSAACNASAHTLPPALSYCQLWANRPLHISNQHLSMVVFVCLVWSICSTATYVYV